MSEQTTRLRDIAGVSPAVFLQRWDSCRIYNFWSPIDVGNLYLFLQIQIK